METNLDIKKYLEENGISQAWHCRKTGIEPVKINLALNGKRKLTLEEYCIVCWALGVNTDKFLHPRKPEKEVV